jgi:hypothetical protein
VDCAMSSNAEPSTAIERTRLAYERLKRREHRAAMKRRARERTRNIGFGIAVAGALAVLTGIAIYNDWMPTSLRTSAKEMQAAEKDKNKKEPARTAQIRSFIRGNTCQELRFNNDSGTLIGGNLVPCEIDAKAPPPEDTPEGVRLNAIRDALKR